MDGIKTARPYLVAESRPIPEILARLGWVPGALSMGAPWGKGKRETPRRSIPKYGRMWSDIDQFNPLGILPKLENFQTTKQNA